MCVHLDFESLTGAVSVAQTVGSLLRTLGESLLAYTSLLAVDLQLGALLSDSWSAAARILRDCE